MRRLAAIATLLLTVPVSALAQVRSAPRAHNTGADAARVAGPGMNSGFSSFGFNRGESNRFGHGFGHGGRFDHRRNNVVLVPSYGYGYPYFGDTLFDNGYESNQGQAQAPPVVVVPQTAAPDVTELRREIGRLSSQIDSMHERSAPAQAEARAPVPEQPPTLLVYRDQHVEQIHNYAIVGKNLWAFDTGTGTMGRKIPLTELDLAETANVNAEHGIHFSAPAGLVR